MQDAKNKEGKYSRVGIPCKEKVISTSRQLFQNVTQDMRIVREEVFWSCTYSIIVNDEEEAIVEANNSEFEARRKRLDKQY